jgi:uncharacterized protein YndB with AHSA1/START domain
MTEPMTDTLVRRSTSVGAPVERAFAVFTEQFHRWWPAEHHIGAGAPEVRVLEPGEGGRWFERAADGVECEWGRVLAWDPPRRLVLSWEINGRWQHDPDPAHA